MVMLKELFRYLETFAKRATPSPAVLTLVEEIRACYPHLKVVLYYGSCFQEGLEFEGLHDFYALVKNYRQAYQNPLWAVANYLLPPNVFYLEKTWREKLLRSKYAVMSLWQFEKAVSPRWFHSYFWGRFCQPAAPIWWADETAFRRVIQALAQAVITFHLRVLPVLPPVGTVKDLWLGGLSWCYRAELRPEKPTRLERLWQKFAFHLTKLSILSAKALPFPLRIKNTHYEAAIPARERKKARLLWEARIWEGKILSVLRLLKASFTFQGGVDYTLWKIERHTGKRLEIPSFLREHPFLALLLWGWKALLAKGVR